MGKRKNNNKRRQKREHFHVISIYKQLQKGTQSNGHSGSYLNPYNCALHFDMLHATMSGLVCNTALQKQCIF